MDDIKRPDPDIIYVTLRQFKEHPSLIRDLKESGHDVRINNFQEAVISSDSLNELTTTIDSIHLETGLPKKDIAIIIVGDFCKRNLPFSHIKQLCDYLELRIKGNHIF